MQGRVFVIGLGLIGGSLALCIKKEHEYATVIGFDVNEKQRELAYKLGIINEQCYSIEEGAREADLILIATPVKEAELILEQLSCCVLKNDVIISDAGSTKGKIVEKSACLTRQGVTFIGGHPMAGSHKSGILAAKERLFENAFYLLTPTDDVQTEKVETLKRWLQGTRAKFLTLKPGEHDHITGIISHFPHIVAASLVHQARQADNGDKLVERLAAGGFRDITRIASSNPEMWRDILLHNKEVLLQLIKQWQLEMVQVEKMLLEEDGENILQYFQKAKQLRDSLPSKDRGAIPAFYDLFVDVPDYPGIISEITGYLAKERISITNIRILETREDIYGVLVISFQTDEDRLRAEKCIHHYTDYVTSYGL
ncbi:prephenate dehydrogenase [Bacillus aquiflavi]|uniref:Prephenate dehydrogenase n=1 Tax=Bacillus aquiflavi TaxID=2672567 RepID=A0A6B3VQ77_9BACI|nr:prephenate dehydrogenase [Bacillus aquiflavi]MBA4536086.1 prephenate dehydrogenase [Bacillus aquiflavi]NEY80460.1 prephenate dehydrogenase [Bacillus aquiflavi]